MDVPLVNSDIIPKKGKSSTQNSHVRGESLERSQGNSPHHEYLFRSPQKIPSVTNYTSNDTETEAFRVFVRYRPLNSREMSNANPAKRSSIVKKEDQMVRQFD